MNHPKEFRCKLHLDEYPLECEGALVTRRSIYGAVMRTCRKAWHEGITTQHDHGGRKIRFDLKGWPEIIKEEEL